MLSALSVLASPAAEPVSLAEAKEFLRLDHDLDDNLITGLIASARVWAEEYTRRAIVQQTIRAVWEGELASPLPIPRPPFVSAVEAAYRVDAGATEQTFTPEIMTQTEPASLWVDSLPALGATGYIRLDYKAGYSDPPGPLKTAIKLAVQAAYDQGLYELPANARALLSPYRIIWGDGG